MKNKIQEKNREFNIKIGIVSIILIAIIISLSLPYPPNKSIIYDRNPTFKFLGKGTLVLSKEKDLSVPILKEDFKEEYKVKDSLDFDTYYWKIIKENSESRIRQFTVQSKVAASIKENKLTNEGNTRANVLSGIVGAAVIELEPKDFIKINQSEKIIYEVSQNE